MNSLLILCVIVVPAAFAQVLHVFGGWAYGRTNGNAYLAGTRGGSYDNANLALNLAVSPAERPLLLEAQVEGQIERGARSLGVDYAFGEWRVSDALRLRAGRAKHPFGICTEVFDVGTLRPFYELPQAVYGPNGMLAESYDGVGISGFRTLGTAWAVKYDVYAGQLNLPYADLNENLVRVPDLAVKRMLGGRAVVETPVDGLSVGASAYTGHIHTASGRLGHKAAGAQVEYLTDRLSLRGEWVADRTGAHAEHAGYAEGAWHVTPHWQAAVRFDSLQEADDRTAAGRHNEFAFGVNYWFTPHLVVKLSAHHIDGTHLVSADAATGVIRNQTHAVVFGTQFSF
jgi:hypothetical protein